MSLQITLKRVPGKVLFHGNARAEQTREDGKLPQIYIRPVHRLYGEIDGIVRLIKTIPFTGTINYDMAPTEVVSGAVTIHSDEAVFLMNVSLNDLATALTQLKGFTPRIPGFSYRGKIEASCRVETIPEKGSMS